MFARPVTSAFVLVLAVSSAALAQSAPAPADTTPPPARVGNIYDHKAHQPTEADLPPAERSGASQSQVEKEVQELLRQTYELDRQSEQHGDWLLLRDDSRRRSAGGRRVLAIR